MDLYLETDERLQLCKTLGAEVCINYKKEDFCKRVKAETGEKGVQNYRRPFAF